MKAYEKLLKTFNSRERPKHFIDRDHCDECAEHDATLCSKNNDTLSFGDVGNISYSPISFITVEGFLYYLPGLARLARDTGDNYFLMTFLIYLDDWERRNAMTEPEKRALASYLSDLKQYAFTSIEYNLDHEDMDELISWLNLG
jgi:hypothetical protein